MKNLVFGLLLSLLCAAPLSANPTVPNEVQQAFTQLYPNVETPFWEPRYDGLVAIFRDEEGWKKAFFKMDGEWIETRVRLKQHQLPAPIRSYIEANCAEAAVTFCGKAYTASSHWYRIEAEWPDRIYMTNLDEQGQMLSKDSVKLSKQLEAAPKIVGQREAP
jgi:hypothetical protein